MARDTTVDISDLRAQALAARNGKTRHEVTRNDVQRLLPPGSFKLYLKAVGDWTE